MDHASDPDERVETARRQDVLAWPPARLPDAISGACGTSPSSATVPPAECDVRTPVAIPPSSGTPIDGPAQSRVSPTDEATSAPKGNGTAETSFDRPTTARSRRRCRIGARRDASRWACRTVLIDQGHGERVGIDAGPVGNSCAQGQQERWQRPAAARSYDWPKNATRRRATTPRISKSANATSAIASRRTRSSASVMKSSR